MTKVKITSLPANGTLKLSGTAVAVNDEITTANLANLTFNPAANWNGSTSFGWNGYDGTAYALANASVNITVTAVNDAPVAVNDAVTTPEDTPVTINVTTNDTDVDGTINVTTVDLDPATAGRQTTFTVAGQGTYSVDNLGVVSFAPALNFNGVATPVSYTVNDNNGATSNVATLTVTVTAVNDAPVAVNDAATTNEDTPVSINVTTNDTDVDGTVDVATVDLDPATPGIQTSYASAFGNWSVNLLVWLPSVRHRVSTGLFQSITRSKTTAEPLLMLPPLPPPSWR